MSMSLEPFVQRLINQNKALTKRVQALEGQAILSKEINRLIVERLESLEGFTEDMSHAARNMADSISEIRLTLDTVASQ